MSGALAVGAGWFVMASLISLTLGLRFANLLAPGVNAGLALPDSRRGRGTLKTSTLNLKDFLTHVFPRNIFESMANNEILQILVFSFSSALRLAVCVTRKAGLLAEASSKRFR